MRLLTDVPRKVPLNALAPGVERIRGEIDAAIDRVLRGGWFTLGPELGRFEQAFGAYHGPSIGAVGVGSGTDALRIALRALGIHPGDEVLVVANAGVPPVAAVVDVGARPVFAEVDPETHTLVPEEIDRLSTPRTRAVLVVHLYGRAADMTSIVQRARARGLTVLEDCAQAHGARHRGQVVGTFGDAAAFSFYPTKNLGALGDGGMMLSADPAVLDRARILRLYGWRQKYVSEVHSTVTRLDDLQAAVLDAKLAHLDDWNARRREIAARYRRELEGVPGITVPSEPGEGQHVYHLFVIRAARRDALRAFLAERGVGSDVHYPLPAHLQPPYAEYGTGPGSLPATERLAGEVLSLPMYPELADDDVAYVAEQVRSWATHRSP